MISDPECEECGQAQRGDGRSRCRDCGKLVCEDCTNFAGDRVGPCVECEARFPPGATTAAIDRAARHVKALAAAGTLGRVDHEVESIRGAVAADDVGHGLLRCALLALLPELADALPPAPGADV